MEQHLKKLFGTHHFKDHAQNLSKLKIASSRRVRILFMAAGAIGLVVCIPAFAGSFQDRRNHLITDSQAIYSINVEAGLWIKEHTPPSATVGVNDAGAIRYFGDRYTIDLIGLNNKDVTFGRVNRPDLLTQSDWLAIFPSFFRHQQAMIERDFELVTVFQIPLADYTICDCPGQTAKAIFRKKNGERSTRPKR